MYVGLKDVLGEDDPKRISNNFWTSEPTTGTLDTTELVEEIGVPAENCCIAWDTDEGAWWVMLQASDTGNVDYKSLSPKDKIKFQESRHTEVRNLFNLGAYRLMSLEESLRFRAKFPDYVLPSRFVEKWKRTDDGGTKAKSRLVILGFKNPHVLQLERSAPTPTHEAFTTVLQRVRESEKSSYV